MLSFLLSVSTADRIEPIGPALWNARGVFMLGPIDIGTHMSFIRLSNGKFLVVDTIDLDDSLKSEFDQLTRNGTMVEAVIATHPFHTSYFPAWYAAYPSLRYYGTPRHLRIQPSIPWAGSMYDCTNRQKWLPEVHMRIPAGAEFVAPQPESDNHFTAIHVFHAPSRTIHVDDTVILDEPFKGDMLFHPSLLGPALYHVPGSPAAFHDWVVNYTQAWDFDNIIAAHKGRRLGGAKAQLLRVLAENAIVLAGLEAKFALSPNATDLAAWQKMQHHEARCKE